MYIHISIYIHKYVHTYIHTDRQTNRQTDKQTYKHTPGATRSGEHSRCRPKALGRRVEKNNAGKRKEKKRKSCNLVPHAAVKKADVARKHRVVGGGLRTAVPHCHATTLKERKKDKQMKKRKKMGGGMSADCVWDCTELHWH